MKQEKITEKIEEIGTHKPINFISPNDLCAYQQGLERGAREMAEWLTKGIWHDGKEKPQTAGILYIGEDGCTTAYYDAEKDRFDSVNEREYSGEWDRCHIQKWAYLDDILPMEGGEG